MVTQGVGAKMLTALKKKFDQVDCSKIVFRFIPVSLGCVSLYI